MKKYNTDEERLNAIRKCKNRYMMTKIWKCEYCNKIMKMAGKTIHCRTRIHNDNVNKK